MTQEIDALSRIIFQVKQFPFFVAIEVNKLVTLSAYTIVTLHFMPAMRVFIIVIINSFRVDLLVLAFH